MCEKHIKLFFCVHRREADDTLFVFILTEGSAAFAYDIIQFFRNSMDYIVNLFLRENKHKLVSALIIKGCHILMEPTIERWYSMKEICEYLGVSRDTVLAWIEKRNMPAAKIGRLWKFKISEVDAWMKSGVAADK